MSRSGQPPDLKKYMDKKLQIKLNANRVVIGTLRGFDQFMNLVVDNTVEVSGNEKNDIGMVGKQCGHDRSSRANREITIAVRIRLMISAVELRDRGDPRDKNMDNLIITHHKSQRSTSPRPNGLTWHSLAPQVSNSDPFPHSHSHTPPNSKSPSNLSLSLSLSLYIAATTMASASALFVAAPPPTKRLSGAGAGAGVLLRPGRPIPAAGRRGGARLAARAEKERGEWAAGIAAAAAALVIPEVAEAAQPGISPSLKNFLLSIVAGGVVVGVIVGAVIAVANFDPVKRT